VEIFVKLQWLYQLSVSWLIDNSPYALPLAPPC